MSITPPSAAHTTDDHPPGSIVEEARAATMPARRTTRRTWRRRFVPRGLRRLAGPFALLGLWWLSTAVGWIGPNTLPPPGDVIDIGWRMLQNGQMQAALWASSQRVMWGLGIGVSAGLAIAVFAGLSRLGEDLFDSTMQVLKAIPNVSLTPLLVIWMGIDEGPKIALIALSTSMPIYMNTYGAIRGVDARLVDTARTLGLGRLGLVRHIVLPGAVPGFLVGLRLSMTSAWIALIFAEQLNAQRGLGKLMSEARTGFRLDLMVLIILTYAVIGLLSYSFVRFLERRLLAWRRGFDGA